MATPSPFSVDQESRPDLVREAVALLQAVEASDPDLVPLVVPETDGPRVVVMYLSDATFLRIGIDDLRRLA